MTTLPHIDPAQVAQKLLTRHSELTFQVAQLEVLAEALRDERDRARTRIAELEAEKTPTDEPV